MAEFSYDDSGKIITKVTTTESDEELTIPNQNGDNAVEGIADKAFFDDKNVRTLIIGANLRFIGKHAFAYNNPLNEIRLSGENVSFNVVEGMLYSKDGTLVLGVNRSGLTLPSATLKVGLWAFAGCKEIEELTINAECTEIGEGAFSELHALQRLTIPNTIQKIGPYAFFGAKDIEFILIEAKPSDAIPTLVLSRESFAYNTSLEDLHIPSWVYGIANWIGEEAFQGDRIKRLYTPMGYDHPQEGSLPKYEINVTSGGTITIRFFKNAGDTTPYTTGLVYRGGHYGTLPVPSKEGYDFDGWEDEQGNLIESTSICRIYSEEITEQDLFAQWKVQKCTVTFDANFNGSAIVYTVDWDSLCNPPDEQPTYDKEGADPDNYYVKGWYVYQEGSEDKEMVDFTTFRVRRNVVLKPIWYAVNIFKYWISDGSVTITGLIDDIWTGEVELPDYELLVPSTIKWNGVNYPVKSIGHEAFRPIGHDSADHWTKVIIQENVETIGYQAFYGTKANNGLSLPSSLRSIGSGAFRGVLLPLEVIVPEGVESIGSDAFSGCMTFDNRYASISLPSTLLSLGNGVFSQFRTLRAVSFNPTSMLEEIPARAFSECSSLEEVLLPNGIETIGAWAFNGTINIEQINLTNSLLRIEDYAFYGSSRMELLIPSSINYIGSAAFSGTSIGAVDTNAAYIGDQAFYNCTNLTDVHLGVGVHHLGALAFNPSYWYTQVDTIVYPLPSDRTTIPGVWLFGGDKYEIGSGLQIKNGWVAGYSWSNANATVDLSKEGVNVRGVMAQAFKRYAPSEEYSGADTTIQEVVFTKVEGADICNRAFMACVQLRRISIKVRQHFEEDVFLHCPLIRVTADSRAVWEGCDLDSPIATGDRIGTGYDLYFGENNKVTVLNDLNTAKAYAYAGCKSLTSISMSSSLTAIGTKEFANCTGIQTVSIGTTTIVDEEEVPASGTITVADEAFSGCTSLVTVYVKQKVEVGNNVFAGCTAENKRIVFFDYNVWMESGFIAPDGFTIEFEHEITSLRIIADVPAEAWKGYNSLENLIIGPEVTKIGASAFEGCTNLSTIVWETGTAEAEIDDSAFSGCTALESVSFPNRVRWIRSNAFEGCSSLLSVTWDETNPPFISCTAFENCADGLYEYVSHGSTFYYHYYLINGCLVDYESNSSIHHTLYLYDECRGLAYDFFDVRETQVEDVGVQAPSGSTIIKDIDIGVLLAAPQVRQISISSRNRVRISWWKFEAENTREDFPNYHLPEGMQDVKILSMSLDCELLSNGVREPWDFDGRLLVAVQSDSFGISRIDYFATLKLDAYSSLFLYGAKLIYNQDYQNTAIHLSSYYNRIASYLLNGCQEFVSSITIDNSVEEIGSSVFRDCNATIYDTSTMPGVILVDGWAIGVTNTTVANLSLVGVRGVSDDVFDGIEGNCLVDVSHSIKNLDNAKRDNIEYHYTD